MNRSGKYELMARDFITGSDEVTYRSLSAQYGRAPSSIARIAKLEGWIDKRDAYRGEVQGKVTAQYRDEYAGRVIQLQDKFLTAAERSIEKYTAAVESGQIVPNPSDVTKFMSTVRELFSKIVPEDTETAGGGIRISEGVSRELVRAIEATARNRIERGAVEAPPAPKFVGTGS